MAFHQALGFEIESGVTEDPALAACLGVRHVRRAMLRLGEQRLELTQCYPAGASYPENIAANDLVFQHIAIVTNDIEAAAAAALAAGGHAISQNGPEILPESSGGMRALKFRDIDLHPLEFLQWNDRPPGYDHSAISVSDAVRSIAFYAAFGFAQTARQINSGPEQDRLDGLNNALVDVVTLQAGPGAPHLELLAYRNPPGRPEKFALNDIAADRLVISAAVEDLSVRRDPDGHAVLSDGR